MWDGLVITGKKNLRRKPMGVGSMGRVLLAVSAVTLASCTSTPKKPQEKAHINNKTKFSSKLFGVKGSPRVTTSKKVRKGGGRYQVGKPYKIRGKWYYPKEQPNYNKVGVASWYGPNFHGRLTANGEIYDQYSLSAAHPTLPLPSYARVTNLENGRSVIVRVNDRGPFSNKRIIDLSAQASKLLGYQKKGLAKVRVKYVGKARMDGLDAPYLMASYRPGKKGIPGLFNPGTTMPGTMLAGLKPPPVKNVISYKADQNIPELKQDQTLIMVSGVIPVPQIRPTPILNGLALDLQSGNTILASRLAPLGYIDNHTNRINQAFAVVEKF